MALTANDRRILDQATMLTAERCDLVHPIGTPRPASVGRHDGGLDAIKGAFEAREIDAALIDLSRSSLGVPVVRAVAPQLQLMPCDLVAPRLQRVRDLTGGGEQWSGGIALL